MSGYGSRVIRYNLTYDQEILKNYLSLEIFHLNSSEQNEFMESIGLNFVILKEWLLYYKKHKDDPVYKDSTQSIFESFKNILLTRTIDYLKSIFTANTTSVNNLLIMMKNGLNILDIDVGLSAEEENFLIESDIITRNVRSRKVWHDPLIKNAFNQWKNDNFTAD